MFNYIVSKFKYLFNPKYIGVIFANVLLLSICIVNILPKESIIAAGDMYQIFDFGNSLPNFGYVWSNFYGVFATDFSYGIYYYLFFLLSKLLFLDFSQQSFLIFFIFLFGSFWSFYFSIKNIVNGKNIKYPNLFSFLYAVNVYVLFDNFYYSSWACGPFLFLYLLVPLIFSFLYKFLNDKFDFKILSILGIILFLSNIANGNMAFFVSLNIFVFLFIILFVVVSRKNVLKHIICFYVIYFFSIAFSVLPQVLHMLDLNNTFKNGESVWDLGAWIIWQAVPFRNLFYFLADVSRYENSLFFVSFGALFFITLFFSLLSNKRKDKVVVVFLLCLIFAMALSNKGIGILSNETIKSIFLSNPLLSALRTSDKVLVFMPYFIISIIYLISIKLKFGFYKIVIFICVILSISFPLYYFLSGNITRESGVDLSYGGSKYSGTVKIPSEYFSLSNEVNLFKSDSKIHSLPYNVINSIGWENYPKWKFVGVDPTSQLFKNGFIYMNNVGRIFNWSYGEYWNNLKNQDSTWIIYMSGLLNSKSIIFHKDVSQSFLNQTIEKMKYYENENYLKKIADNDYFSFYLLNDNYFLQHFYTPETILRTDFDLSFLPKIVSQKDYNVRSVIYFGQNKNVASESGVIERENVEGQPVLEFKKISPVKYRVNFHKATGVFPLIFSESFDNGWKVYLRKKEDDVLVGNRKMSDFKIVVGNESERVSPSELEEYISQGLISSLGDGVEKEREYYFWNDDKKKFGVTENYKIDFISKNINGTIQNNNLSDGNFYETWFKNPIVNNTHSVANGFANSWILDIDEMCVMNNGCIKNTDGTYDFQLVVEFWPQRLYYIGLFVSGTTLLVLVIYLMYYYLYVSRRK